MIEGEAESSAQQKKEQELRDFLKTEFPMNKSGQFFALRADLLTLLKEQEETSTTSLDVAADKVGGWPVLLGEVPPKTRPAFLEKIRILFGIPEPIRKPPEKKLYQEISTQRSYTGSKIPFGSAPLAASTTETLQRQAADALTIIYAHLFRETRRNTDSEEALKPKRLELIVKMIELAMEKYQSNESVAELSQRDALALVEKIEEMLKTTQEPKQETVLAEPDQQ